jgi:hypothetical protein
MKAQTSVSSRISAGSAPVLEDAVGFATDLVEIRTSAKKESMAVLRGNTATWLQNNHFEKYRVSKIDLAIVIYVTKHRPFLLILFNNDRFNQPGQLVRKVANSLLHIVYVHVHVLHHFLPCL